MGEIEAVIIAEKDVAFFDPPHDVLLEQVGDVDAGGAGHDGRVAKGGE